MVSRFPEARILSIMAEYCARSAGSTMLLVSFGVECAGQWRRLGSSLQGTDISKSCESFRGRKGYFVFLEVGRCMGINFLCKKIVKYFQPHQGSSCEGSWNLQG